MQMSHSCVTGSSIWLAYPDGKSQHGLESCDFLFAWFCVAIAVCGFYTKVFEHLPLHLDARDWRIKEMASFEGEAKDSERVHNG